MLLSGPRTGLSRRTTLRLGLWLSIAVVLIAGAAWLRPRLMQDIAVRAALDADSIDDAELRDAGAGRDLSAATIGRLWGTGRLPHRRAAISALTDRKHRSREIVALADRLLSEAAVDPDLEVRTRALGGLTSASGSHQLAAAAWQLDDADPESRRLGLQTLRRAGGLGQVPWVLPSLTDPDPTVALFADSVLRSWSGRDSGLRLSRLLPERSSLLARPVAEEDTAAIRNAADGWRTWWETLEKPADLSGTVPARPPPVRLPCPPIRLPDLSGRIVDVESFRGKWVVLNFWTTWCPACLVELPLLSELQRRHPDDLVVIGISLDSTEPGELADAVVQSGRPATKDKNEVRKIVAAVAGRHRLSYPVLLDPENAVGRKFNGGELPTNVLLDREGFVRRRFVGERSVAVWEAFLRDATKPGADAPR